jgi:hypothetical protein
MPKFLTLFFFLALVFSTKSNAASMRRGGAELLNAKAYSAAFSVSAFSTTAHLDSEGTEFPLPAGASYRLIDTDFKISYGLSSNLETSLFGKFRNVTSNNGVNSATKTGPESLGVEAKYSFPPIDQLIYAMGLRYRQSLYTNTRYSRTQVPPVDEVILGDDGSEYGVDFYATYLAKPWKLDVMVGYNAPPNDLSSEIVYKSRSPISFFKTWSHCWPGWNLFFEA